MIYCLPGASLLLYLLVLKKPLFLFFAALHLAAAAADLDSVALLLAAGANTSVVNSCGLCPGGGFLRPPHSSAAMATVTTDTASSERVKDVRRAIREHRERLGHVRRLADASTKRVAVEAVADRATASVHRFVDFALKVPMLVEGTQRETWTVTTAPT